MDTKSPKVMVLGLDGADSGIIEPLMAVGKLPQGEFSDHMRLRRRRPMPTPREPKITMPSELPLNPFRLHYCHFWYPLYCRLHMFRIGIRAASHVSPRFLSPGQAL